MNISISKEKLAYISLFFAVMILIILGIYLSNKRKGESEIVFENEDEEDMYADISGAVAKPSVYKLPYGSRVNDLLSFCGGFTKNASIEWVSKNLNLSEEISDSEKIYIPFEWEIKNYITYEITPLDSGGDNSKASDNSEDVVMDDNNTKIDLNLASQEDLESLPGVGEITAKKIISGRPYKNEQDLIDKSSLSKSLVEKIRNLVIY